VAGASDVAAAPSVPGAAVATGASLVAADAGGSLSAGTSLDGGALLTGALTGGSVGTLDALTAVVPANAAVRTAAAATRRRWRSDGLGIGGSSSCRPTRRGRQVPASVQQRAPSRQPNSRLRKMTGS